MLSGFICLMIYRFFFSCRVVILFVCFLKIKKKIIKIEKFVCGFKSFFYEISLKFNEVS